MMLSEEVVHKLQELAFENQVLILGVYGEEAGRIAFSAARIDAVGEYDAEQEFRRFFQYTHMHDTIFLHVGEPEYVTRLFLPNFDMTYINYSKNLYNDLNTALDKTKYGGVIAIDNTIRDFPTFLEAWFEDRCTFQMTTGLYEYHPPTVGVLGTLAWFTINWKD